MNAQAPKVSDAVELTNCVLSLDGKEFKAIRQGEGVLTEINTKIGAIATNGDTVWLKKPNGDRAWTQRKQVERQVHLVSATEELACFAELEKGWDDNDANKKLHVIKVATGDWLPDIEYKEALSKGQRATIVGASTYAGQIAVQFNFTEVDAKSEMEKVVNRVIRVYDAKGKSIWTKAIPIDPIFSKAGRGLLMAASYPNFADSDIVRFSWDDNNLTVCPDESGPIVSFDASNGEQKWSLERPWEFSRGFIGPSVWSDYLARFGEDRYASDKGNSSVKSEQFAKSFQGHIIAGPVFVPTPEYRGHRDGGSYFVAVSLAKEGMYAGYTGDCILYQVRDDGEVIKRTTLPQHLYGKFFNVGQAGVSWLTQNRGMIQIRPSDRYEGGMGPGGPDATGEINWFFQMKKPQTYWLSHDPARNLVVFDARRAYVINEGWHMDKPGSKIVTFPIHIVDLESGTLSKGNLAVSLTFPATRPSSNYRSGEGYMQAMGSGMVGITGLTKTARGLRFQIATEKAVGYVEFEF